VRLLCESDPQIVGCVFDDNRATQGGGAGSGGGLYMQAHCDPTILNCTFSENHAFHIGGGAAAQNEASPTFVNCLFADNECSEWGGGLRSGFETVTTLINCTFRGNDATLSGGGISAKRVDPNPPDPPTGLVLTLRNCLVWGNTAGTGNEIDLDSSPPGQVEAWNCDVRNGPNDIVGGIVVWKTPNLSAPPNYDAHSRPGFDSLCLNQGDPNLAYLQSDVGDVDDDGDVSEPVPIDAGQGSRRVNPPNRVDIGAMENQIDSCVGDIAPNLNGGPDGIVDAADLSVLLARWGTPGGIADLAPPLGNNTVDVGDLDVLLGAWGPCPSAFLSGGESEAVQGEGEGDARVGRVSVETPSSGPDWPVARPRRAGHLLPRAGEGRWDPRFYFFSRSREKVAAQQPDEGASAPPPCPHPTTSASITSRGPSPGFFSTLLLAPAFSPARRSKVKLLPA
jgi:predicted outer membrane repeat protein